MFAPDAAEAGSEAKALQAAAQKALGGEIDARAERLSQAADDQFVLTADGTIRWTGDAVAKLVAADDVLRPRVRIIADDRLSGAPREAVQARIEKWLTAHIEKLLGPLFDISKAEDITGLARGIGFQLVEALGVLERQKIATEMKDLDQASRAVLRKYGVRFGAYHIYLPALLKPAARSLASLLWALKQETIDLSVLSTAQHMASSGRTSFAADPSLDRIAYRTLGYRLCGARAVRVDILERLADLIRPALAWRPGSAGVKPAGAFDGRSFTVTQPMTSLTGSSGEDFASILRALGYRLDRCAPLPETPAPVPASVQGADSANSAMTLAQYVAAPESSEAISPEPAAAPAVEDVVEAPADATTPDEAQQDVVSAPEIETAAAATTTGETAAAAAATEEVVAAADVLSAPQLVEVWRIGRSEERRPRHQHARPGNQDGDSKAPARHRRRHNRHGQQHSPAAEAGSERSGPRPERSTRRDRSAELAAATQGAPEQERHGRPNRGRDDRRNASQGFQHGTQRNQGGRGGQPQRERPADPNSPFAKLAALREQLAANAKEPRS
jgi:ATP-dependent RNA helicase SUPV3L1/SUV3